MEKNYIQKLGRIAFASRLKQLTELLLRDMVKVYKEQNIAFEPRWFTFVHLLKTEGQLSLTEIARHLNQTHVAANQVANALEKNKLIETHRDKNDNRKRMLRLSKKGHQLVQDMEPLWSAVRKAIDELFQEAGIDLLNDISKIEASLDQKNMAERIREKIDAEILDRVVIVTYKPVYKHNFIDLNLAWLEKYFEIESHDEKLLFEPDQEIIGKGGNILLAKYGDEVIGTAALLKVTPEICELTKMTVAERFQGHGIGRKLLSEMIAIAKEKDYLKMILLTSPRLENALKLYRSFGFVESNEKSLLKNNIQRCSIQLEMKL